MSTATVLKFMQETARNEALRQELEALLGVGDGNISSEAELDLAELEALKGERAPIVTDFAAKSGYVFSVEELISVVDAFQQHQAGDLPDRDFAQILGASTNTATNPLKQLTSYLSRTYLGVR